MIFISEYNVKSIHEKIRHPCDNCSASFASKHVLKIHVTSVHEGKNPHSCTTCDLVFPVKSRLNNHIKEVHENKNRQICSICNKSFSHLGNLKAHIASVHEGKENKEKKELDTTKDITNKQST